MNPIWAHPALPSDPVLVDNIVNHMKSQGVFDQFRYDCLADVDTKPSYQNLSQRVDGYVSKFLSAEEWNPDMNKNELRNKLRRQIETSGMLSLGVDHIIEQLINTKIHHVFLPKIEEVVQEYIDSLKRPKEEPIVKQIKIESSVFHTDTDSTSASSKESSVDLVLKSLSSGAVKTELKKPELPCSKAHPRSNLPANTSKFQETSTSSKPKVIPKDFSKIQDKPVLKHVPKIGTEKVKRELVFEKDQTSQDSTSPSSAKSKPFDKKSSSVKDTSSQQKHPSHSSEKHISPFKTESKSHSPSDKSKQKELIKCPKLIKSDVLERTKDKKSDKHGEDSVLKKEDKQKESSKDKVVSQMKSKSSSNNIKPKTTDPTHSKPKLVEHDKTKLKSKDSTSLHKDGHHGSTSSKEHHKSSHSNKDSSKPLSKSTTSAAVAITTSTASKHSSIADKSKSISKDSRESSASLHDKLDAVLLLSRTPTSKTRPPLPGSATLSKSASNDSASNESASLTHKEYAHDGKSSNKKMVLEEKSLSFDEDISQDMMLPSTSSKSSTSSHLDKAKTLTKHHSSAREKSKGSTSRESDVHEAKSAKHKADFKSKTVVTDSDSSQSSSKATKTSDSTVSSDAEGSHKSLDAKKKKQSCREDYDVHMPSVRPPSPPPPPPPDVSLCVTSPLILESMDSKDGEKSDMEEDASDLESNISSDGISSVHTSDLSSFDDNISLPSGDEGSSVCSQEVKKVKKKVTLKEAAEILEKTVGGVIDDSKQDEEEVHSDHESVSIAVDLNSTSSLYSSQESLHNIVPNVQNNLIGQNNGICSEELDDSSSPGKRITKRQRKLNPKYASNEYASIFNNKSYRKGSHIEKDGFDTSSDEEEVEESKDAAETHVQNNVYNNGDDDSSKASSSMQPRVRARSGKRTRRRNSTSSNDMDSDDSMDTVESRKQKKHKMDDNESQYRITLKITKVHDGDRSLSPKKTRESANDDNESPELPRLGGKKKSPDKPKAVNKTSPQFNSQQVNNTTSRLRRRSSAACDVMQISPETMRLRTKDYVQERSKTDNHVKSERSTQRYDSSDLYKPRPVIHSSSRRSRAHSPPPT